MRLICSGSARRFIRANSLGLKQLFHDVGNNSIFALLLEGLTIRDMNTDPVLDLGTLKSHIRKLSNNTSAANLDGRPLVGGSGGITSVARTTNSATADSMMATWDVHHLEGGERASPLADEKPTRGLWAGGRIDMSVSWRNSGGTLSAINIRCA